MGSPWWACDHCSLNSSVKYFHQEAPSLPKTCGAFTTRSHLTWVEAHLHLGLDWCILALGNYSELMISHEKPEEIAS